jgi:SAM-dependent methyltransferase
MAAKPGDERMGLGLGIMPRITHAVRRLRHSLQRRRETRNLGGSKVALGERLHYGFPRDWIHVDWQDADLTVNLVENPILPFKDNSTRLIFSAHLIEHLPQETLPVLLRECYRILKPGGRIRIECPDIEKLVELYRRSDDHMLTFFRNAHREQLVARFGYPERYTEDHLSVLGEIANYIVPGQWVHTPVYSSKEEFDAKLNSLDLESLAQWCRSLLTSEQRKSGGHQNVLYFSKLKRSMEEARFCDIVRVDFGHTTISDLELNKGAADSIQEKPHRAFYSLYVEAAKH